MALEVIAAHHRAEATYQPRANRLGLWIFLASETFLFSAALAARYYLVHLDRPEHLNQPLGLLITGVLLLSSVSAYRAEAAIAHDNRRLFMRNLAATIGLGLVFVVGVGLEWAEALAHFPPGTPYGSVFVLLIGLHAFHVITGLGILAIVLNLGRLGHFNADDHWYVEAGVKYWHFVDVAWVFIFPTLYLVS
jgi:cytochrome c oxidase subunit III